MMNARLFLLIGVVGCACAEGRLPQTPANDPRNPEAPEGVSAAIDVAPTSSSAAETQKAAAAYSCPMHPEVTSAEPGKCHKCGMALVKASSR